MVNGLRIEMLGGLTVTSGDRPLGRFRTRKTASVLGYLAFHVGRTISRDVLIENFWPDDPERQARDSLNTALSSLRRQLTELGLDQVLFADRNSVRLEAELVSTDVAEFRALAAAGDLRALELYKGDLLEGFYEAWVIPAAAELAELKEGLSSRGTRRSLPTDNLPRIDNAFVGREREMEQLSELCERNSFGHDHGGCGDWEDTARAGVWKARGACMGCVFCGCGSDGGFGGGDPTAVRSIS
jgi:two-component SAPR family response regulator